ncbi:hypothetical protein GGR54DRAFT_314712 [Hypoxylon sp. NC1633]|nr:hypothetical protein GGR54DRAFT_314712 [Hypoxylon sp. NC1633]
MVSIDRRSEDGDPGTGITSADRAKTVGLAILALVLIVLISNVIVRYWIKPEQPPLSESSTPRHGEYRFAEQSQDAGIRSRRLTTKRKLSRLSFDEIDLVAPEMLYSQIVIHEDIIDFSHTVPRPPSPTVLAINRKTQDYDASLELASLHTTSLTSRGSESNEPGLTASAIILPRSSSPLPIASDPECSICLEGYRQEDLVRQTLCRHLFHKSCLEWWLMKHGSRCPLCQRELKQKINVPLAIGGVDSSPTVPDH